MAIGEIKIRQKGVGEYTTLSPYGRTFTESMIELSREERTAGARLVRDVIATKRLFTLSYSLADWRNTVQLFRVYYGWQTELDLLVHYVDGLMGVPGVETLYHVLMRPFDMTRVLASREIYGGLWGDITIEFEEV
jgi:hypothetical protein